jgi:hypothetical protein
MKQLYFCMFEVIMIFYISLSSGLNIYTLRTVVESESFSVFRVDSRVQKSGRLCCKVRGMRPSSDGSLVPDNFCGNFRSKKPRNSTWKYRGPLLRLSEVVCHWGSVLPDSAWEGPPTCLGILNQSQCVWKKRKVRFDKSNIVWRLDFSSHTINHCMRILHTVRKSII